MCFTRVGGLEGDFSALLDAPHSAMDPRAKTSTLNNTWLSVLILPILISFVIGALFCGYGKGRCKECWTKRRGGGEGEDDRRERGGGDARWKGLVAVAESRSQMLQQRAEKVAKACEVICSKLDLVQEKEIQRIRNRHQQPQQSYRRQQQSGNEPQHHRRRTQQQNDHQHQQRRPIHFPKGESKQRIRTTQHSPNTSHNSPLLGANACPLDSDISVENSGFFDVNACPLDSEVSVHKQDAIACPFNSDVSLQNTGPFSVNTCPLDSEISVHSRPLTTVRRRLMGNTVLYQTPNTLQTTQQNQMATQRNHVPGLELRYNKDDSCYSQKQHNVAQWLSSLRGAYPTFNESSVSCERGFVDRFGSHKFKTSFTTANRTSHLGYKLSISSTKERKHRTRRCSHQCRHDCVTGSFAHNLKVSSSSQSKDHESYGHTSKLKDNPNNNPNPQEEIPNSNPNSVFGYKHGCGQRICGNCAYKRLCTKLEQPNCHRGVIGDHRPAHVTIHKCVDDVRFCPKWRQLSSSRVYGKNRLASSLHKDLGFKQPLQEQHCTGKNLVNKEESRINSLQKGQSLNICLHKGHDQKKTLLREGKRSGKMIPPNMCGGDFSHSVQLALRHLEDRTTQGTDSGVTQPCTHQLYHQHYYCPKNRHENHHHIQNHRQRDNGQSHPHASGPSRHHHVHHHHIKQDHRHHHNYKESENANRLQYSRGVSGSPRSRHSASSTVTSSVSETM